VEPARVAHAWRQRRAELGKRREGRRQQRRFRRDPLGYLNNLEELLGQRRWLAWKKRRLEPEKRSSRLS
jgi:hypothetical protein